MSTALACSFFLPTLSRLFYPCPILPCPLCGLPSAYLHNTSRAIFRATGLRCICCTTLSTLPYYILCLNVHFCLPFKKCYSSYTSLTKMTYPLKATVTQRFYRGHFFNRSGCDTDLLMKIQPAPSSSDSRLNRSRYERIYGSFSARSLIPSLPTQCSCFHCFHQSPPRYLGLVTSQ